MKTPAEHRSPSPAQVRARILADQQNARLRHQVSALAQLDALHHAPEQALQQLAPHCTLRVFAAGAVILNERAASSFLYLVLRGTVSFTLHDRSDQQVLIGVLNRGDCFGEGPLFGDLFRGATVHAETACYLLQIPIEKVRAIMDQSPGLAAGLRATYRQHLVASTIGRVPMFGDLSPLERTNIMPLLQSQHYERGALIIEQGQPGQALYIIESGQVAIERDGQAVAYLDEGHLFGEISMLSGEPHNADVRALTPTDVLVLPREECARLLEHQPSLTSALQFVAEQRLHASALLQADEQRARQVADVVTHGLLRGTHLLVRDTQLCPSECRLCETACVERHGQSRMQLDNVRVNTVDITASCRQCRVGAECVEACPEQAIQWSERGALVITDQCTGCGECVPACPYDAVKLTEVKSEQHSPMEVLRRSFAKLRIPTIALEPVRPKMRASKCDLCHGYDDMACVTACPTGALRLVPVEQLFPL
jgi:CRP-like cAMP-binding protein